MIAMSECLVTVGVMVSVLSTGCTNAVDEPQFKITIQPDNDKVEVKVARDTTICMRKVASRAPPHMQAPPTRVWPAAIALWAQGLSEITSASGRCR